MVDVNLPEDRNSGAKPANRETRNPLSSSTDASLDGHGTPETASGHRAPQFKQPWAALNVQGVMPRDFRPGQDSDAEVDLGFKTRQRALPTTKQVAQALITFLKSPSTILGTCIVASTGIWTLSNPIRPIIACIGVATAIRMHAYARKQILFQSEKSNSLSGTFAADFSKLLLVPTALSYCLALACLELGLSGLAPLNGAAGVSFFTALAFGLTSYLALFLHDRKNSQYEPLRNVGEFAGSADLARLGSFLTQNDRASIALTTCLMFYVSWNSLATYIMSASSGVGVACAKTGTLFLGLTELWRSAKTIVRDIQDQEPERKTNYPLWTTSISKEFKKTALLVLGNAICASAMLESTSSLDLLALPITLSIASISNLLAKAHHFYLHRNDN